MIHITDVGIILKKNKYKDSHSILTIYTKSYGKISLLCYGVKKITSKRLSHLETGNYIKFYARSACERNVLVESELIWGFSKIKNNYIKLDYLYQVLRMICSLLPEKQEEQGLFLMLISYLTKLNNTTLYSTVKPDLFHKEILYYLGYIDKRMYANVFFEPVEFVSNMLGRKISKNILL